MVRAVCAGAGGPRFLLEQSFFSFLPIHVSAPSGMGGKRMLTNACAAARLEWCLLKEAGDF